MRHQHDHDFEHDVEGFATVLAGELPGHWTVDHREHANRAEQMNRAGAVWDMDTVADAIARHPLGHDAILARDDGTRLYVTGRPSHEDDFLVAAIAPPLPPAAFEGVREPDGVVVPADPFAAADAVATGLLPRYEAALAQVQDNAARLNSRTPVTLTWVGPDLHATADVSEAVRTVLTEHGFVPSDTGHTFVLNGDDTALQAQAVRAVGARLATHGTHLALRHPAPRTGPDTATATPVRHNRPAARVR
ncbi:MULTISPECIES: hypothetical protein [Streptomyces]|uniref:Uncharacterized protein n=1 Tax=Streptomyces tsukubensis (strain DSM 42081 / NBRC 108919 / NRRL 18488 / 9993) TaxID=1114943 RepID=I2N7Y1_STRT9|nr:MULTISPECIES: hypothetical protein [Streptomyces]AZK97035.1 hypothetical protein B7R87_26570 [Streptomyces tsukubensis]EIF93128.1 hypothetical protein [Streptomyces tsukubensis NRRL18488]MYS66525.1 hypothetical protein [Streptomyces sp. SID5473]QKM66989.1 hypothetical protein STSU_007210 [Streptomyces tsukubensis NRRL18488]TAI41533.1 hypothetical protein EWI31_27240 [Streptomyces tsukubensis]